MAAPGIPSDIYKQIGPLVLGNFFNWGLLGILTTQTYFYYVVFPRDGRFLKLLVAAVYAFEIVQTVLATKDAWVLFALHWGNPAYLTGYVGATWFYFPIQTAIMGCTAQLFFAWRIYVLSKRDIRIPIATAVLCVIQLVAAIWTGVHGLMLGTLVNLVQHIKITNCIWLGSIVLCDIMVAASLSYYLLRSKTGFKSTDAFLSKIVRLVVETGCLTSTFAILDLTLSLGLEQTNWHLIITLSISKLYSNNLLLILNSRTSLNSQTFSSNPTSSTLTAPNGSARLGASADSGHAAAGRFPRMMHTGSDAVKVQINRETHTDVESDAKQSVIELTDYEHSTAPGDAKRSDFLTMA